jgi:Kdo2-lipid IVA lauroyltransferase/acyltransferase
MTGTAVPRWYHHRWNTLTSLRLIRTAVPRLPRPLVPLVGAVASTLSMAAMHSERRAATRNLARVTGRAGWRLRWTVWRLFYCFGRYMVSTCDLARLTPAELSARVENEPGTEARIPEALARGNGAIALTAHLGNWEAALRLLDLFGAPVHVVMHVDRANAAERSLMGLRESGGVRVINFGESPSSVLGARAALARNEILAMQGDRSLGERTIPVTLFGGRFPVPLGPFLLAYLCDAPLLPCFVLQQGFWRWRLVVGPPIQFPRTGERDTDLAAGAAAYAALLESVVRRHPDQWFNFFDMWPDAGSETG